jgi:hypothetical protein
MIRYIAALDFPADVSLEFSDPTLGPVLPEAIWFERV